MINPEKKVEQQIRAWCFQNHIMVNIYDSKATYSTAQKGYRKNTGLVEGHPDLVGLDRDGQFVAIELKKSKGEKVARLKQLQFLLRVIEYNGFGAVISSTDQMSELYTHWKSLNLVDRRDYLKSKLPRKAILQGKVLDWEP